VNITFAVVAPSMILEHITMFIMGNSNLDFFVS